jgi:hypothetical protein
MARSFGERTSTTKSAGTGISPTSAGTPANGRTG